MARFTILIYGVVSYLIFFATFLYAIGFMGNLVVPKSIDSGASGPLLTALLINVALLSIFAIQHSVMARPAFKSWWTRIIPKAAERSTYTLLSSLALILMFHLWRPMGGVIWQIEETTGQIILYSLFGFGWALVLVSTFLINHFDLFGLRQVWLNFVGRDYTDLKFGTPGPYKLVRHPLYLGWLFAFWATPTMTVAHLAFAIITTIYILLAIRLEEHDLVTALGEDYANYRERVPMIIPFIKGSHNEDVTDLVEEGRK